MKDEILTNLNDPRELEKMYRTNKMPFKQAFSALYPKLKGNAIADFWNERLNYQSDELNSHAGREIFLLIFASLVAGVIAKLPALFHIDEAFFYQRNIGFIVFP